MQIRKFVPTKENWKKLREFCNSLKEEKKTLRGDIWPTLRRAKIIFVAWFSDNIIGVAGLSKTNYAFNIIKKEFQGQGLGQRIVMIRNREIGRLGFKKIRATSFNPVAVHVLKKEGFKELYTQKNVNIPGLTTPRSVHYFELSFSIMSKLTFPFRKIGYILYAKFWRFFYEKWKKNSV